MARSYSMLAVRGAADRAVAVARTYLRSEDPGGEVHDVQADPRFQARGVDLVWERTGARLLGVEVKGDRQAGRRGTYFFELVSNLEKDTPGCFLYSQADVLLYVFLQTLEVHRLPLVETRAWFLAHAASYPLRHARTRVGAQAYTTVGAVVPARHVLGAVAGARRVPRSRWEAGGQAAG